MELLRSAIENVVRNSVRYTAEGTEVEIALSCRQNGGNSNAVISVRDHGAGVPEAALAACSAGSTTCGTGCCATSQGLVCCVGKCCAPGQVCNNFQCTNQFVP